MSIPTEVISHLEKGMKRIVDAEAAIRTKEWEERSQDNSVRSSTLAVCTRKAYYNYWTKTQTSKVFNEDVKRTLWLGFLAESIVHKALETMVPQVVQKVHTSQNVEPVHLSTKVHGVRYNATTDFVLEMEDEVIPIECKSTEQRDAYWRDFEYYDYHLRQLVIWMWIAKKTLPKRIPYGMVVYIRRSSYEIRPVVIYDDGMCEVPLSSMCLFIPYDDVLARVEADVARVQHGVQDFTLPLKPSDVPSYMCKSCAYESICKQNLNVIKKEDASYSLPGGEDT